MTWEELVANITDRHPVHESKMFGMPCLKRENGKVVAGFWKDGGVNVKLVDEAQHEAALAIPGAEPFDPGMGRPMREWVLVPASQSDQWERLVDQAISSVGSTELPKSGGAGFAGAEAESG
jgi:hypothetical protein